MPPRQSSPQQTPVPPPSPPPARPPVISPPPTAPPKSRTRRAAEHVGGKVATKIATKILAPYVQPLVKKLNAEIEKGNDFPAFTIMMLIAVTKDLFDIVWDEFLLMLQGLIVVGQVTSILLVVLKFLISLTLLLIIMYFMSGKGWLLRSRVKWTVRLLWFFGWIPVIEMFPMETLAIMIAWKNIRQRARKAKRKLAKVKQLSQQEAEELIKDITLLDLEPEHGV